MLNNHSSESQLGLERMNLLGVGVSAVDQDATLKQFDAWVDADERHYVCVCNVHAVMECHRSDDLRRAVNRAGLVVPDGMPLVWLLHRAGFKHASRVYGPKLMLAELARSSSRSRTHFFFGGAVGVAHDLQITMEARFPGLRVVGAISPPAGSVEELATPDIADAINAVSPDVVWVGLGCPKQEKWMAVMRSKLHAPILVGVGAAFDFNAGLKPQATGWMMRSGLEWLFRLATEPRRLWRRYAIYNPWFMWSVALQLTGLARYEIEA